MERIIDNKNGTYSFERNGQVIHTGKWGDNWKAPKATVVNKGTSTESTVYENTKKNVPRLNLFDFSTPTQKFERGLSTAKVVPTQNNPDITGLGNRINPFASMQQAPSPIKAPYTATQTTPIPYAPKSQFTPGVPGLSTIAEDAATKFQRGLEEQKSQPIIQPKQETSIIPNANAANTITEDELDNLINGLINEGFTDDEIGKILNEDEMFKDMTVIPKEETSQQAPKKEELGFMGAVKEEIKGIGSKTADFFKGGIERIGEGGEKLANADSFMDYAEGLSQGVAGTFQSALSPIAGFVGQGIEPYVGLAGKGYKEFIPEDIQKAISSKTSEGIKQATDWYNSQPEPIKQKLRTAGYLTEIGAEFLGVKPTKEVGKQLLKGGEKALEATGEITGKQFIKGGEKLTSKGVEQSTKKTINKSWEVFSPYLNTKKAVSSAEKFGTDYGTQLQVKKKVGGLITENKLLPSKYDLDMSKEAAPFISKLKTGVVDESNTISNLNKEIKRLDTIVGAKTILAQGAKTGDDFIKELKSLQPTKGLKTDNAKILNDLVDTFIEKNIKSGKIYSTNDIFVLRKEFDNLVDDIAPSAFDYTEKDLGRAVMSIRKGLNDMVSKDVGPEYKELLNKESLLINARKNLSNKLVKTGGEKLFGKTIDLLKAHPYLSFGAVTGAVGGAFIPALLAGAGIVAGGKLALSAANSATVKKELGKYLTGLGKLLGQTSDTAKKEVIKEQINNTNNIVKLLPGPSGKPLTTDIKPNAPLYVSPKGNISPDLGALGQGFKEPKKLLNKTELNKLQKQTSNINKTAYKGENPEKIAEKVRKEIANKKELEQKELEQLKQRQKKLMEAKKQQQANRPKPLKKTK